MTCKYIMNLPLFALTISIFDIRLPLPPSRLATTLWVLKLQKSQKAPHNYTDPWPSSTILLSGRVSNNARKSLHPWLESSLNLSLSNAQYIMRTALFLVASRSDHSCKAVDDDNLRCSSTNNRFQCSSMRAFAHERLSSDAEKRPA